MHCVSDTFYTFIHLSTAQTLLNGYQFTLFPITINNGSIYNFTLKDFTLKVAVSEVVCLLDVGRALCELYCQFRIIVSHGTVVREHHQCTA